MKVLTPGHCYELANFENPASMGQEIQFIEKSISGQGGGHLKTDVDGTTNEEVLAMLIDRLKFLGKTIPCRETSIAITKLDEALMWLNKRTQERKARGVEGSANP
jgi:hypothetical protein